MNWLEVCGVLFLVIAGAAAVWLIAQAVFLALVLRKMR